MILNSDVEAVEKPDFTRPAAQKMARIVLRHVHFFSEEITLAPSRQRRLSRRG
jgi:hypothetical protein